MSGFWIVMAFRMLVRRVARSAITLSAIAVGVGLLVFLGAIMVGVSGAMVDNSVSLRTGHVLIQSDDPLALVAHWRNLRETPHRVRAILPRLTAQVMLSAPGGAASVALTGVLPERESGVSAVPARIVDGEYLSKEREGLDVCLGRSAAQALGVKPGQRLTVKAAGGGSRDATVAGVFDTGIDRYDETVAYARLDDVKSLSTVGRMAEVAVFLERGVDPEDAIRDLSEVSAEGDRLREWREVLPELDQLIRLNRFAMLVLIVLITLMMAAGVSNTVMVSVMDRYRQFGLLDALGATPIEIAGLVLCETAFMCLASGVVGLLLGVAGVAVFAETGIDLGHFTSDNPHFVMSSVIHPRLTVFMSLAPPAAALALSALTALWPATVAARRHAAELMRGAA